ncbi:MAG: hypothetical protein SF066_14640 [Thermoanaerobaculia bacterium]|nr:hypothetical protein [Thermoanaerobaculia bacterium]
MTHPWLRRTLGIAVFLLAYGARSWVPHTTPAAALGPRPDALEYVAGAQAIAQEGRYFLQVGPDRVRPRYPPGFSLLLAGAVKLGVAPAELWRVSALFGAALAVLVGFLAAAAVGRLRPGRGELLAFAVAGGLWALAPAAVAIGRAVMSDEPATLFLLGSIALTLRWAGRPTALTAGAAAVAWAVALAIRPVAAIPAGLVLLPIALAGWRTAEPRKRAKSLAAALGGAAVVVGLVIGLLLRSGLPAWPWDGYAFWVPERFGPAGSPFALDYALRGDPTVPRRVAGQTIGHFEFVARSALGLPGLPVHHSPGFAWPGLGLAVVAVALGRKRWRRPLEAGVPSLALGLGLWLLFHGVFYSLYFFAASRFLLVVFATSAVAVGAGLGVLASRPGRGAPALALGLALAVTTATAVPLARLQPHATRPDAVPTADSVAAWLASSDDERLGKPVPFDPVHVQALGLLPTARAAQILRWGTLPPTDHVVRLQAHGATGSPEIP